MTFDEAKEGYLESVKDPDKLDEYMGKLKEDYDLLGAAQGKISEQEAQIAELTEAKNKYLEKLVMKQDISDGKEPEEEKEPGIDWDAILKDDKED